MHIVEEYLLNTIICTWEKNQEFKCNIGNIAKGKVGWIQKEEISLSNISKELTVQGKLWKKGSKKIAGSTSNSVNSTLYI